MNIKTEELYARHRDYIINEIEWPQYLNKPDNLIEMHNNGLTGYLYNNKQTITNATNGEIDDMHPSYEGHDDISNYIINFIKNETINIHNA